MTKKDMNEPLPDDSKMLVQLTVNELRAIIRGELETSKKHDSPRLLYNNAEAAKILDVPATWLAAQARAGKIPVIRLGHYVRFSLADLEAFAKRRDGVDTPMSCEYGPPTKEKEG